MLQKSPSVRGPAQCESGPAKTWLAELGTRYLKSSGAAAYRYSNKSSAAAATCTQNSGRCRYFKKKSTKNDGIQIRYLMVKFQLYLRKLIV